MTNALRAELEHDRAAVRVRWRTALEEVAVEHRRHRVCAGTLPGQDRLRYVARRRPGSFQHRRSTP